MTPPQLPPPKQKEVYEPPQEDFTPGLVWKENQRIIEKLEAAHVNVAKAEQELAECVMEAKKQRAISIINQRKNLLPGEKLTELDRKSQADLDCLDADYQVDMAKLKFRLAKQAAEVIVMRHFACAEWSKSEREMHPAEAARR